MPPPLCMTCFSDVASTIRAGSGLGGSAGIVAGWEDSRCIFGGSSSSSFWRTSARSQGTSFAGGGVVQGMKKVFGIGPKPPGGATSDGPLEGGVAGLSEQDKAQAALVYKVPHSHAKSLEFLSKVMEPGAEKKINGAQRIPGPMRDLGGDIESAGKALQAWVIRRRVIFGELLRTREEADRCQKAIADGAVPPECEEVPSPVGLLSARRAASEAYWNFMKRVDQAEATADRVLKEVPEVLAKAKPFLEDQTESKFSVLQLKGTGWCANPPGGEGGAKGM